MPLEFNQEAWDDIVRKVVEEDCVPRCRAIAEACNDTLEARAGRQNEPGYIVGVDGGKPLEKHDFRSTVITKTNQAMVDNAEHNTLVNNLAAAEGPVPGGKAK